MAEITHLWKIKPHEFANKNIFSKKRSFHKTGAKYHIWQSKRLWIIIDVCGYFLHSTVWNVENINIYSDFGIVDEVEWWWIGSEWRVNDNMRLTQYCAGPLPFALLPIELLTNALLSTFSIEFWGAPGTPGPCRRTDLVVHRFLKCWFCLIQKKDCSIERFVSLMIKLWSIRKPIDMNHPAATLQCIVRDMEHVDHVYCLCTSKNPSKNNQMWKKTMDNRLK